MNLDSQTYKQSNQSIELINKSGLIHIDPLFNNRYGKPIRWVSDPTLTKKEGFTKITYSFPGLNGNNFSFNGYLPVDKNERSKKIRKFEIHSKNNNQSQIFIETPYRNQSLFHELIKSSVCLLLILTQKQITELTGGRR